MYIYKQQRTSITSGYAPSLEKKEPKLKELDKIYLKSTCGNKGVKMSFSSFVKSVDLGPKKGSFRYTTIFGTEKSTICGRKMLLRYDATILSNIWGGKKFVLKFFCK